MDVLGEPARLKGHSRRATGTSDFSLISD